MSAGWSGFYTFKAIDIEPGAGACLPDVCLNAINLATEKRCPVSFLFNGIKCVAKPGGDPVKMYREFAEIIRAREREATS